MLDPEYMYSQIHQLCYSCLFWDLLFCHHWLLYAWLSFHLVSGLPIFPVISTFLPYVVFSAHHIFVPFQIFLESCSNLMVPRMCSFLIFSLHVTPHIHRSILISLTLICCCGQRFCPIQNCWADYCFVDLPLHVTNTLLSHSRVCIL